jgi:acetylornithine/succinyldiaminopimelate/putrescine aminotransferase
MHDQAGAMLIYDEVQTASVARAVLSRADTCRADRIPLAEGVASGVPMGAASRRD